MQYTVVGGQKAAGNLHRLSFSLRYVAPAFDTVGGRFRNQVEAQFALSGLLPGTNPIWRRLAPFTRSQKGSGRVLIDSSLLLQSYTDTRAKGNINEIRGDRARFGSGYKARNGKGRIKPIAKFHQEGTRTMPERPIVLGNPVLDEEIVEVFADHLFRGWRR